MIFNSLKSLTIPEGEVVKIANSVGVLWQKNRIPIGAIELEYIESTGTQWINAKICPTDTSIKCEVKIAYSTTGTGQLMGAGTAGTERFNFGIESGKFRFGFGSSWFDANNEVKTPDTEPHIWVLDAEAKAGYIDGVEQKTTNTYSPSGIRAFVIFARGSNTNSAESGNRTKGKLYYVKLWDKGVLVRDLIPVLDENKTACLYDKVSGQYFYNQGTREFLFKYKPPYLKELEYIESTGTQYIDTGIMLTSNHTVEIDYQLTEQKQYRTGLFGGLYAPSNVRYGALLSSSNAYLECGYGLNNAYYQLGLPDTNRHLLQQKKNVVYFDGALIYTFESASFNASKTSYLGIFDYTNYKPALCRYYGSKWYDGDELVRDFVPVLDKNKIPCMYDKVTGELFYNKGTGTFSYG